MKIYNEYEIAKPTYIIKGEGAIRLIINNETTTYATVMINVGQEVTINTELELCFKNDQMINLALEQGSFQDLYLQEGMNVINYYVGNGGALTSIEIIPNWKTI